MQVYNFFYNKETYQEFISVNIPMKSDEYTETVY